MPTRRLPVLAFVILCLALSGLVIRRQMAAHPIRPAPPEQESLRPGWQTADGPTRRAVLASIQGQLTAFREGDAAKAMFYQSHGLRRNFASPQVFLGMIRSRYPAFGHCQSAQFGPVRTDKAARFAEVVVTAHGPGGQAAQGDYEMVWEDGRYRVAGVRGGGPVRE